MTAVFRRTATSLGLILAAQAAHADLTPQQVWTDWKDYLASSGYEVSAQEATSGDTLTVSDLKLTLQIPDEDATINMQIPSIDLTGRSGKVSVSYPNPLVISVSGVEAGGAETVGSGNIVINHTGMVLEASGDPSNLTYVHAWDSLEMTLADLAEDGRPIPPEAVSVKVTLGASDGTATMKTGAMRDIDQTFTIASVDYDFRFDDPTSDDGGTMTGGLTDLTMDARGTIPAQMDTQTMKAMLDAGFTVDGGFTYGAGKSNIDGVGDGEAFTMSSASQGGELRFAMTRDSLAYDVAANAMQVTVAAPEMPFPVSFEMARAALKLAFPTAKTEEPQDFALGLTLGDFTMSDMIWGMFDPSGKLPRDPATVALDLTGKAALLFDMMDPEQASKAGMSGAMPADLESLQINDLKVSAVGADLSGNGAFTFDSSDMASFNGIPKPTGKVDLALTGANALIDKLIEMGLVSQQDAMGARMMMGMIAVPGDGPDSLKSTIEINEAGNILANGQRIK
ncbi:DUF2125 domain-containing protein [Arenibacterium halophilum]|uniref:DUF2125 domain-containing protein n=1 Tax=Arenibacterium halophilum TaxID=2583821 RepID=A0ABY2X4Z4_9RHOB|nr:DUF2125 domain-containing protein [Arenibacterium halophilum]TMV10521.1 DUF2125 domain-containing protein [Arenibacterium halophilum]